MKNTKWHITQYFYIVLIISAGRIRTKLYNKREDFNFPNVNVSFIGSNIPTTWSAYLWVELIVPIMVSLMEGLMLIKKATEPVVPSG